MLTAMLGQSKFAYRIQRLRQDIAPYSMPLRPLCAKNGSAVSFEGSLLPWCVLNGFRAGGVRIRKTYSLRPPLAYFCTIEWRRLCRVQISVEAAA